MLHTKDELKDAVKRYAAEKDFKPTSLMVVELVDFAGWLISQNSGKPIVSGSLPLVEALDKYIELLVEELNETVSMAATHGWKSSRAEEGERLRNRIAELRRQ